MCAGVIERRSRPGRLDFEDIFSNCIMTVDGAVKDIILCPKIRVNSGFPCSM